MSHLLAVRARFFGCEIIKRKREGVTVKVKLGKDSLPQNTEPRLIVFHLETVHRKAQALLLDGIAVVEVARTRGRTQSLMGVDSGVT